MTLPTAPAGEMVAHPDQWPYDADRTHRWVAQHRLPVVSSASPQWNYHVAVVLDPHSRNFPAVEPCESEAAQLASYLRFVLSRCYRPSWIEAMAASCPFDIDGSTVTRTFLKRRDGSWAYRQSTWTHGPWPFPNSPKTNFTLVELLDKIESLVPVRWAEWKAAHPGEFPPPER